MKQSFSQRSTAPPKPIREIQYWLYHKAKEYGYRVDTKKSFDKDVSIIKRDQAVHLAGEREFMEFGFQHRMFPESFSERCLLRRRAEYPHLPKKAS